MTSNSSFRISDLTRSASAIARSRKRCGIRPIFFLIAVSLLTRLGYTQQVSTLHVQGSVYMLVGAGGNIGVQIGEQGVLLVDSGSAQSADQVIAAVKQLAKPTTTKPLRYILNTHFHSDHTGGNDKARASGVTITGGNVAGNIQDATQGAAIYA